jgi:hypothetical protein
MSHSPFAAKSDHAQLLLEYLTARCLDPGDFPEGLTPVTFPELLKERGYNAKLAANRPFIFLRYLNHRGEPYYEQSDTAKENPFELVRFLGEAKTFDGKTIPPSVIGQIGRPNVLHYEPLRHGPHSGRSWSDLPDGTKVLHLESMVKARAVHKATGIPCIGLNGVESFSSSKKGVKFLYEDQEIDFSKFHNVVLFDSNADRKPVAHTREKLLSHFKNTMACKQVGYIDLPKSPSGEDWGVDEFLRENGALTNLQTQEYKGASNPELLQAMSRAVYCTKGGMVVDREDKHARSVSKARDFYAKFNEVEVINGAPRITRGFEIWLASPYRTEVINPAYEYLADEFIERDGQTYYNAYKPSGTWPDEHAPRADIAPIVRHLKAVMKPEDLNRLRSYGKFLKFSSSKPTSFPILYSDKRGVGKGWFGKILYRLIGAGNTTNADARSFSSNFNAQIANKRLVIVNEFKVPHQAKEAALNSLKRFFGDELITVEPKGVDPYEAENRAGMVVTCNTLEDVPTDGIEDRRMWYVRCHAPNYEPDWLSLHNMLDEPEVMNAIHDWFMEADDINFSFWKPPLNEERKRAIRRSMSTIDEACNLVLEDFRELGIVCTPWQTIIQALKPFIPNIGSISRITVQAALKRATWEISHRPYGTTRSHVWIVNGEEFHENDHDAKWVAAELARTAEIMKSVSSEPSELNE